jgi:hypothetical protein
MVGVRVIRSVLGVGGGGEVTEIDYSRIYLNWRLIKNDALLKLSCI